MAQGVVSATQRDTARPLPCVLCRVGVRTMSIVARASLVAVGVLLAACNDKGDPKSLAVIVSAVPMSPAGRLYVSVDDDRACSTDCPPPSVSRGWVVDCDAVNDVKQAYVTLLRTAGFVDGAADDEFDQVVEGVEIHATLSVYRDASQGPQPTEEPFVSDPAILVGACSVFVLAIG